MFTFKHVLRDRRNPNSPVEAYTNMWNVKPCTKREKPELHVYQCYAYWLLCWNINTYCSNADPIVNIAVFLYKSRKLENLDLSHNQLYTVPAHLPRVLQKLSLQHNFIQTIAPDTLSHLRPGLHSLLLSHNQLPEHGLLGKAFRGAYKTLVELHLDNNRLERVPPNIRYFSNLHQLRLDHNLIR